MTKHDEEINYFFELGDQYQPESQRLIGLIASYGLVAHHLYRWRAHALVRKQDCRLFELTDMVAWEWARHVNRHAGGHEMRKSLRELIGDVSGSIRPSHEKNGSSSCYGFLALVWIAQGCQVPTTVRRIQYRSTPRAVAAAARPVVPAPPQVSVACNRIVAHLRAEPERQTAPRLHTERIEGDRRHARRRPRLCGEVHFTRRSCNRFSTTDGSASVDVSPS